MVVEETCTIILPCLSVFTHHSVCCRDDSHSAALGVVRIRRGCHKPAGIRPLRSESLVAACLGMTVVVYPCVSSIGVFQFQNIGYPMTENEIN